MEYKLVLRKNQYTLLWYTSWFSLVSSLYAIHRKYYDLSLVPGGIFLTSINYWRKPDYSWRRYIDITYVQVSNYYQLYRVYKSENFNEYSKLVYLSILYFFLGVYYHKKGEYWISTFYHALVHLLINTGYIILYSGKI